MSKDKGGDDIPADIAKMSFETALEALEEIVQKLERGEVSLEDSIDAYTRGTQLKRHCEAKLKDAQARVDKIVTGPSGGAAGLEPADIE
jgi:exodeoxyribonuclease VII small subunit